MAITNGYASLSEVKAALRISDTVDDSLLEMAIESASRLIDGYAARTFYNGGTATKEFAALDQYLTYIDDLQSLTTLSSTNQVGGDYTEWPANSYQLEPVGGKTDGLSQPYTAIRAVNTNFFPEFNGEALVKVTGVWGWASVPTAIKQATIIQSSRIFKRLDSPLGVAGFGDLGAIRVGRALDPDVEMLVNPYRITRNIL